MARREIGFAVVGACGVIGDTHIKSIQKAEGARLVAVCDILQEEVQKLGEELGVPSYKNHEEMLVNEDIEVVSVCTPSGAHAEIIIDSAKAQRHVLTEKPLDVTLERIDVAIEACKKMGVKLGCIFQNRTAPANQKIKEVLASGRLGKLLIGGAHAQWYRSQEYYDAVGGWRGTWELDGGGSLMNQSIHTIDMLQWFMGPVVSVNGKTDILAHDIETEDLGLGMLRFENGAHGILMGTTCAYPGLDTKVEIFGENGCIITSNNKVKTWRIKGEDIKAEEEEMVSLYGKDTQGSGSSDPKAIRKKGHLIQIEDMAKAVLEDRDPMITGIEGRHAVEIILAVYESSRTGKEVKLPL